LTTISGSRINIYICRKVRNDGGHHGRGRSTGHIRCGQRVSWRSPKITTKSDFAKKSVSKGGGRVKPHPRPRWERLVAVATMWWARNRETWRCGARTGCVQRTAGGWRGGRGRPAVRNAMPHGGHCEPRAPLRSPPVARRFGRCNGQWSRDRGGPKAAKPRGARVL